ncbi:hypothetical protein [Pseudonocardia sp. ICBG1293]|uniref:hypothetical protein n=1 Tax=Pseudonocardia sp. ICBG1293 TaxID=2844382 RepID=UPI001CCF014E|nr:hypothetical protein [Pseudonocardia sp. ICBG1293]
METSAHEPRGSISDALMLQIDVDNVMNVYARMDEQARALHKSRFTADSLRRIPPCGDDPVSLDAASVFQPKIDFITQVHLDYLLEVVAARDRLKEAAQEYGLMEDESTTNLKSASPSYGGPLAER